MSTDELKPLPQIASDAAPRQRRVRSISEVVAAGARRSRELESGGRSEGSSPAHVGRQINGGATAKRTPAAAESVMPPALPTTKIIHTEPIYKPASSKPSQPSAAQPKLHPQAKSSVPIAPLIAEAVHEDDAKPVDRTGPKRWVLADGKQTRLVERDELAAAFSVGTLSAPELRMREEHGLEWHHPLHFVNEFSMMIELESPTQPISSVTNTTGNYFACRKSSTSRLIDYFDAPLDEQYYKDRHGLTCRNCGEGYLVRYILPSLRGTAGLVGLLLIAAAAACVSFGVEVLVAASVPAESYQELADEAFLLISSFGEISEDAAERLIDGRAILRADFYGLSSEATSALQQAEILMEEAGEYRREKLWGYYGAGTLFLFAAAIVYYALSQLGHYRFYKCDNCRHVVRR